MAEKRDGWTNEERMDIREVLEKLKDAVVENRKIVLPIVLVAAILVTMGIGISANKKKQELEGVQTNAQPGQEEPVQSGLAVPDDPLEENAYPEINELIMKYYKALEENNVDVLPEIVSPVTDSVLIRFAEWAKHMEACPAVNIYTKKGPREDSYIAYVVADVQIVGYEETVPGLISYFICKNEDGNYYINMEEEIGKEEADYIETVNFQDDVVDMSNKISADFNQLVQNGSKAADAFLKVEESITKGIQEALLANQPAEEPEEEADVEAEAAAEASGGATVAKRAKAIDVVNMRSSDSEKADKLGKAQVGDEFAVLEEKANGWTKLSDGTKEFFIKSQYLEIISEEAAAETQTQEEPAQEEEQTGQQEQTVNVSLGSSGYVTAKTTVNVRKSANETGEKLGVIYQGERLELVMNQADGWCKVKYQGQTAYVKSEFME